jgi:MFS superfamily sulfate permease-like transporter
VESDSTAQPADEDDSSTWKNDLISGFLVFLIALPLCLGISMASGFPPLAGILTAVIGGLVSTWLGSARLTIKGPAAGLIVIALGAVQELGGGDMRLGYRRALATIAVAAVVQILFALFRAGTLGDFFPSSVVQGMLAAIGVVIFAKQAHSLLGVTPSAKDSLALLEEIPHSLAQLNPPITLIGVLSLVILFGHPYLGGRLAWLKRVPAPLLVLLVAVSLGFAFDLDNAHTYTLGLTGAAHALGPQFLVNLPDNFLSVITFPDFSAVFSATSLKYIAMFAIVGSIESLLITKAVDSLDPEKRRSDLDKDLLALGVGNLTAGLLGGLPMISEIVRSSASIGYGAKSRLSNFFHGLFLLLFVAFAPALIHRIPLAALAAMLIYTGVRLASPSAFVRTFRIGPEQLFLFSVTLVTTLATDLLVGVITGVVVKLALHLVNGATMRGLFQPFIVEHESDGRVVLRVGHAAVFSNYLGLKKRLARFPQAREVVIDLSRARLVDHTVMERLRALQDEFGQEHRHLELRGLDRHRRLSAHPLAARKKPGPRFKPSS